MAEQAPHHTTDAQEFLDLYPVALPQVYGFLLARCGDADVAEDLTSETFMAGAKAIAEGVGPLTIGWLVTVARRRLVDYWRRLDIERRSLRIVAGHGSADDPWDEVIDIEAARSALSRVAPQYRAVLTLRYIDGLAVPEAAELLGRSVHATESLLARARAALREVYEPGERRDA